MNTSVEFSDFVAILTHGQMQQLHDKQDRMWKALVALRDAATNSNDHCYGTLSTAFVLDIVEAALKCGDHSPRDGEAG